MEREQERSPYHKIRSIQELTKKLLASEFPLTINHHRILREEMMLVKNGYSFFLAINADHSFLQKKNELEFFQECMEKEAFHPLLVNRRVYFIFRLTVKSNPSFDDFKNGSFFERRGCFKENKLLWWIWYLVHTL